MSTGAIILIVIIIIAVLVGLWYLYKGKKKPSGSSTGEAQ